MEHARKMVLIDEKILESLRHKSWEKPMRQLIDRQDTRQSLSWKRPADVRSKTALHKRMKDLTADDGVTLPDDVRAKLYTQELTRFQRIKPNKIIKEEVEETKAPRAQPDFTVADLIDIDTEVDVPISKKKKTKSQRKVIATPYTPLRTRSQRKRTPKITNFDWIEY
jgi:hypothetical protein